MKAILFFLIFGSNLYAALPEIGDIFLTQINIVSYRGYGGVAYAEGSLLKKEITSNDDAFAKFVLNEKKAVCYLDLDTKYKSENYIIKGGARFTINYIGKDKLKLGQALVSSVRFGLSEPVNSALECVAVDGKKLEDVQSIFGTHFILAPRGAKDLL